MGVVIKVRGTRGSTCEGMQQASTSIAREREIGLAQFPHYLYTYHKPPHTHAHRRLLPLQHDRHHNHKAKLCRLSRGGPGFVIERQSRSHFHPKPESWPRSPHPCLPHTHTTQAPAFTTHRQYGARRPTAHLPVLHARPSPGTSLGPSFFTALPPPSASVISQVGYGGGCVPACLRACLVQATHA